MTRDFPGAKPPRRRECRSAQIDQRQEAGVRFVVEVLSANDESVQGTVRREGRDDAAFFCGWLELLRLLEPAGTRDEPDEGIAGEVSPGGPRAQRF